MSEFEFQCSPFPTPTSQHRDLGQITGPECSHLHSEDGGNVYSGSASWAIDLCNCIWLCLKGPRACGLVLYNCHLEILNSSNIFNYSVKCNRTMDSG